MGFLLPYSPILGTWPQEPGSTLNPEQRASSVRTFASFSLDAKSLLIRAQQRVRLKGNGRRLLGEWALLIMRNGGKMP